MAKSTQSPLARINRIMKHLTNRGCNSERVNELYRKILLQRKNKVVLKEI